MGTKAQQVGKRKTWDRPTEVYLLMELDDRGDVEVKAECVRRIRTMREILRTMIEIDNLRRAKR